MNKYDDRMAYNIYSDPDLSKTSRAFKSFTIDFEGVQTPIHTYWALCNFGLYFSEETKAAYPNINGGGAYAGLQMRDDGRKAIMAFWEMTHGMEDTIMRATRVYPAGEESNFGGEGEGTNCIRTYDWKSNSWYRMVLHSWEDKETGRTFVGQWVCDLSTGKWDLISYFNSRLYNSCLRGGMSLFQENYIGGVNQYVEREFHVKNIYVRDRADDEWKSLDTTTLSYGGGGADNKAGAHSFGATEDYFWGIGGGPVEDQEAYEAAAVKRDRFTIKQPSQPELGKAEFTELAAIKKEDGKWLVCWNVNECAAPQVGFKVELLDDAGNVVATVERTRPEVREAVVDGVAADSINVKVTVTDIYGNEVVASGKVTKA